MIIDCGEQLNAIEIKSSATVNTYFFKNLNTFANLKQNKNRERSITKQLVYGGETTQQRSDARLLSWRDVQLLTKPESE
ncbi:MAG TPA: hypothetical protein ENG90_11375 [Gammaproteobacteria bacterium]|nr:hypothetical protein [Gammaproteobacteria bacterium]